MLHTVHSYPMRDVIAIKWSDFLVYLDYLVIPYGQNGY